MEQSLSLDNFVVFNTLSIHQLRVEPNRVKAVYTLEKKDGAVISNELIYSFHENCFNPSITGDVNLASMMVAQVAINYGLFCETIIFDGYYDGIDRQFIKNMIENTSREIYVNKLLSKNEFLKPPYNTLKAQKKKSYTSANIIFKNSNYQHLSPKQEKTIPDANQFAILSSGGKDSLLSYGILKEIGSTHPIYVNEAGRHWYTAYNAFHGFEKIEPNTARVWCNSDRIFNWMVKQMPFIKDNFQNIKADIYPIRLWTVAVFLFGVLPIVRKRGIKNIIIGNEYDTTLQLNQEGITHYAALYDQSKYFDNAFTRYYRRKGWDFYQYSILRSLSELLILKILVKRYPDLQQMQVSCHAAHKEGERMVPCGNCEKCRRIVGMLKAMNEDPKRCGYTDLQIENCLKALQSKSVKQLGSDAQQLYYMLLEKGLIASTEHTQKMGKHRPEIMKLRFDNERSQLEDLPKYVRNHLFSVYSQYAEGAMKMINKKWQPTDLNEILSQNHLYKPLKNEQNKSS